MDFESSNHSRDDYENRRENHDDYDDRRHEYQSHDEPRSRHDDPRRAPACNKRNKTLIVFVVLLALCSVGLAGYITYDKLIAPEKSTCTETTTEETSGSTKTTDETTETVATFNFQPADSSNNRVYSIWVDQQDGVQVTQKISDLKSAKVSFNYETARNIFGSSDSLLNRTDYPEFTLTFDSDVREIVASTNGQDAAGNLIAFLLADGTIEYLPTLQCLQNGSAYTKKVDGLTDISHILTASASDPDGGGYVTTLAQKSDGTFYDLTDYNLDLSYK